MGIFKIKDRYYVDVSVGGKRIRKVAGDTYQEALDLLHTLCVEKQNIIRRKALDKLDEIRKQHDSQDKNNT